MTCKSSHLFTFYRAETEQPDKHKNFNNRRRFTHTNTTSFAGPQHGQEEKKCYEGRRAVDETHEWFVDEGVEGGVFGG